MKKNFFTTLVCLSFFMSACGAQNGKAPQAEISIPAPDIASLPTSEAPKSTEPSRKNPGNENTGFGEQQLLLGIFELEGTDNAITKEQAAVLSPLVTNLKTIMETMIPMQGEMPQQGDQSQPADGQQGTPPARPTEDEETQIKLADIIKEITDTLTPEQIQAITEMEITQETTAAIMEELGITVKGPASDANNGGGPGGGPGSAGDFLLVANPATSLGLRLMVNSHPGICRQATASAAVSSPPNYWTKYSNSSTPEPIPEHWTTKRQRWIRIVEEGTVAGSTPQHRSSAVSSNFYPAVSQVHFNQAHTSSMISDSENNFKVMYEAAGVGFNDLFPALGWVARRVIERENQRRDMIALYIPAGYPDPGEVIFPAEDDLTFRDLQISRRHPFHL